MDDSYFEEFLTGINNAWKVGRGIKTLYNGLPPVVPVGPAPAEAFRVAITLSAIPAAKDPAHETFTGSVFVNDEEIEFDRATRLTSTEELTELPEITAEGLDCNILVECVTTSGAPIYVETLMPMEIVCFPKTTTMRDPSGSGWMQTDYNVYAKVALSIGDRIKYNDPLQAGIIDLYVKNVGPAVDLEDNSQPFRAYYCS